MLFMHRKTSSWPVDVSSKEKHLLQRDMTPFSTLYCLCERRAPWNWSAAANTAIFSYDTSSFSVMEIPRLAKVNICQRAVTSRCTCLDKQPCLDKTTCTCLDMPGQTTKKFVVSKLNSSRNFQFLVILTHLFNFWGYFNNCNDQTCHLMNTVSEI